MTEKDQKSPSRPWRCGECGQVRFIDDQRTIKALEGAIADDAEFIMEVVAYLERTAGNPAHPWLKEEIEELLSRTP